MTVHDNVISFGFAIPHASFTHPCGRLLVITRLCSLLQDIYALGGCNPVVSLDLSTGIFIASPIHLGFRLHVNKSYAALAATPGQLDAFTSSTRDALVIAFKGPLSLIRPSRETEVYIRSIFASAWPNAAQGARLIIFVITPFQFKVSHFTCMTSIPPWMDFIFPWSSHSYVTLFGRFQQARGMTT